MMQPVMTEKRIVAGSRPLRSQAFETRVRTAASSSGDAKGVLYSSANRAAGSAVPRVPLPPTMSGGCGSCTGFGRPGALMSE